MNSRGILFFYIIIGLVLIVINDQATWFVMSGVLLVFEWQIAGAVLFGITKEKRLDTWKNVRFFSHFLYLLVLAGAFLSIKSWFPNASDIGLILLGGVCFSLKELTFRICRYQAITSQIDSK